MQKYYVLNTLNLLAAIFNRDLILATVWLNIEAT